MQCYTVALHKRLVSAPVHTGQPLIQLRYSGLICDVIPAIDLAKIPHSVPSGNQLNLTKCDPPPPNEA